MLDYRTVQALTLFPASEQERVRVSSQRYDVAMEDVDELVDKHAENVLGKDRAARWGRPDTALNALAQVSHALSNPGHYSRQPMITGPEAARASDLTAPLWPLMQHVEYLTYAVGSMAVLVDVSADGEITYHPVPPHHVWATPDPMRPSVPLIIRRLLLRTIGDRLAYTWDIYDISDPANPTFSVRLAEGDGKIGDDVTTQAIPGYTGDYAWRRPDRTPYLPWAIHRTWEDGSIWSWMRGRSTARGALMAMMYFSAAGHAAFNSTGKVALIFGATPMGGQLVDHGSGIQSLVLDADPGNMVYHTPMEGTTQPSVTEIGTVDTLPALAEWAGYYAGLVQMSCGVMPTDATRASANPMSGVAISLSNASKRDEQLRANPIRRPADMHLIRVTCWLSGVDPAGLGIVYHEITSSPDEERAAREADEWEASQGLISKIDLMMRRRPGLTREQARAEIMRVRAEDAEIDPTPDEVPT